jgi:hypothetical protein
LFPIPLSLSLVHFRSLSYPALLCSHTLRAGDTSVARSPGAVLLQCAALVPVLAHSPLRLSPARRAPSAGSAPPLFLSSHRTRHSLWAVFYPLTTQRPRPARRRAPFPDPLTVRHCPCPVDSVARRLHAAVPVLSTPLRADCTMPARCCPCPVDPTVRRLHAAGTPLALSC